MSTLDESKEGAAQTASPQDKTNENQYAADRSEEFALSHNTKVAWRLAEEYCLVKHLVLALGEHGADGIDDLETDELCDKRPLEGKTVVDLACGAGHYSRMWVERLGAKSVAASDLAEDQIKLARKANEEKPLPIVYTVADASADNCLEKMDISPTSLVDVVIAVWLDPYMASSAQLTAMLTNVCNMLKPGGVFVQTSTSGVVDPKVNHEETNADAGRLIKMFENADGSKDREADVDLRTVSKEGVPGWFRLHAHIWSVETYKAAAKAAGFEEPQPQKWEVSKLERKEIGEEIYNVLQEGLGGVMVLKKPE